ncbi:hypothetical protein H696_05457 [Fonticula alba]|uniref:Uncharacterized protein n=1 Tax=Fonticula alba TaxID=691883 RepID=A0A058Z1L1_FONAL|nr:hypothetical protein H696_05457 [Fonticula alba]KCV67991.1 hypothetical protein H696_05457 [Fonticula alba]|eukprot:XP_009497558.1 hypothetical protein H696_05457 [Fonticula alba]
MVVPQRFLTFNSMFDLALAGSILHPQTSEQLRPLLEQYLFPTASEALLTPSFYQSLALFIGALGVTRLLFALLFKISQGTGFLFDLCRRLSFATYLVEALGFYALNRMGIMADYPTFGVIGFCLLASILVRNIERVFPDRPHVVPAHALELLRKRKEACLAASTAAAAAAAPNSS